ncbi:MAG: 2-C-methyl-D-erythritol 2,4-cyclodiphosphate synthase [Methylococcaceae bacterium]|nr:MAG: 2-C-methyl-D-erythritol 2,4-cyclodiphosphate synthase [Methylococcaceae bacterium]
MNLRIGMGYDAHQFRDGGILKLCGVTVPHARSLAAHSDGDVALHALCDALLGAAALGDIGKHFPDTDPQLKGVDSRLLLRQVRDKVREKGFGVGNVDVTVIAQEPRLAPYIAQMRECVAADLNIGVDHVNVKATTTERMGFEGRGEGISAQAVALLVAAG